MSSYQIDDPFSTEDLLRPYLFDEDHFYEDLTWMQEPLQPLVTLNSSSNVNAPEECKYPVDNHKDGLCGVFHEDHCEFYDDNDYEWCEGMIEGADVTMSDAASFAKIQATSGRAVASFPVPQKIFIEDQQALKSTPSHFNSCANVESPIGQNSYDQQNFHQQEVQSHYYEAMIDTGERKLKRKLDIEPEYLMNEFLTVPPPSALEEAQNNAPISSEVDDQISNYSNSFEDDPTGGFKLPASKSPVMEAMVVCALNGWGIRLVQHIIDEAGNPEIIFQVLDFERYYRISRLICSKQRPTDDVGSRVKSLRRWFTNFPKKKVRCEKGEFLLTVKPNIAKKVSEIIERNTRVLGLMKRRRRQ